MPLEREIEEARRLVKTDAYQISIGELINMYRDSEFIINPDFQRLFRWEIDQKSKLIELILLGIPLPSIFVFEQEDLSWELIDGYNEYQRYSNLWAYFGILKRTIVRLQPLWSKRNTCVLCKVSCGKDRAELKVSRSTNKRSCHNR